MATSLPHRPNASRKNLVAVALLAAVASLFAAGCERKAPGTDDPQLKPIQEMLDQQVPAGAPEAIVLSFLNARGYPIEPSNKQGTVVTKIRHIDTQTLQPVTAKVTFYFDATGHLNTYEIQRVFNDPTPQ